MPALGGALIFAAAAGFPVIDGGGSHSGAARAATTVPVARVDHFDASRAFALLRAQVAVGQRPAGSPQLRRLGVRLRAMLPRARFEDFGGGQRNIVGVLPGRLPATVIGAHYDSEAHPPGFVGANDSAAGTAAVVELARDLRATHRRAGAPQLRFVLFDGEEEPLGSIDFLRDALRGSRAYVRAHRREVGRMILLDYVANKGLTLPREQSSDARLWARLRAAARRVGVAPIFPRLTQGLIYDDHTPFLGAHIPAIDLIDFSYRYKDTVRDTVDKVSPRSLDAVGESVYELVRGL